MKEINIKNRTYQFFDDKINIKDFDLNQIKIDRKYYNDINIYYIGHVTVKDYLNIRSVNPVYLIFKRVDGYIEERNGNIYLVFASTDKNKEALTKYK